jgi:hypothetical protein
MEEKIRLKIEDLVFDTFETSEGEGITAGTVFPNVTADWPWCKATEDPNYGCLTDPVICVGTGGGGAGGGTATAPSVCYPASQVCVTNRQVSCNQNCPGWIEPTAICGTTGGRGTGSLYCGPEPTQGPDHTCAYCL